MEVNSCNYSWFGIQVQCTMLQDIRDWCRTAKEGEMLWMDKLAIENCLERSVFFTFASTSN